MTQIHQLAAIMFTDIVGYTALMGSDEDKAMELVHVNRELQKSLISKSKGKWLKEMGDGVLASFPTASDAVHCALEILEASTNIQNLALRIGIHLGEVIVEDEDIFGDGVNIASRIQAEAKPGQLVVSESVHRNVRNKVGISSKFLKKSTPKNIDEPIKLYNIKRNTENTSSVSQKKIKTRNKWLILMLAMIIMVFIGYHYPTWLEIIHSNRATTKTSAYSQNSIAVLAFDDQSPNGDQEWLGDGIADEILNILANSDALKVTGKTSSFSFKGKGATIKEIGKSLNVATIVEGSVSRVGNQLRITAQLIDTESENHIWSRKYDRDVTDIFNIIDEVAQNIVSSLLGELTNEELENIKVSHQVNSESYNSFFKGRSFYENSIDSSSTDKAIYYFKESIELDSTFALPWTYLSMCYWRKASTANSPLFKIAKQTAAKALELDPSLSIAIINMAEILDNEYRMMKAKELIDQAIEIDPSDPYVLRNAGRFYSLIGGKGQSISYCQKALEKDPVQLTALLYMARAYFYAELYDEALNSIQKRQELGADIPDLVVKILLGRQQYHEALMKAISISDLTLIASAYFCLKKNAKAEEALARYIQNEDGYVVAYDIARAYAYGNQTEKVLTWLEKSFDQKEQALTQIKVDPAFIQYRNEPRFKNLLSLMNFPTFTRIP